MDGMEGKKKTEAAKSNNLAVKQQEKKAPPEEKKASDKQGSSIPVKQITNTAIDKELKKELQKQQKKLQQIEERIAALTQQKTALEAQLASPDIYSDKNKFLAAETGYQKNTEALAAANNEYEQTFERLLELEEKSK